MSKYTFSPLRLLVPLDGSGLSEQALPYVRMLGELFPVEVTLLRVVSPTAVENMVKYETVLLYAAGDTMDDDDDQVDQVREKASIDAAHYLEQRAAELADATRAQQTEVAFGVPAETIDEVALAKDADMVLMASHGYSGLRRWAIGSVAMKTIRMLPRPVFVVRGQEHPPTKIAPPKRIMVPLDGSAFAEQALPLAAKLAKATGAELQLTHVVDSAHILATESVGMIGITLGNDSSSGRHRQASLTYLDRHVEKLHSAYDIKVTTAVPVGHIAEELLDEMERKHVDLVVMATHGHSGSERALLGSTTEKLLQAAPVPVIAVRD